MIGKQTKGTSFGGCVRYVLKEEKSKLLEAVGVDGSPDQKIINDQSDQTFTDTGGCLADTNKLSGYYRGFCHLWLNIFRIPLQIYYKSLTFASGFGQNLSGIY